MRLSSYESTSGMVNCEKLVDSELRLICTTLKRTCAKLALDSIVIVIPIQHTNESAFA